MFQEQSVTHARKLGNMVAKLGNISLEWPKQMMCPRNKNVFDFKEKHFFVACPTWLNWETFASATMFRQICFLV